MTGKIQAVTDEAFEQDVLQSSIPVVVDFWAPWCGPCKMIAPILEELVDEFGDKIKILKMNVDENDVTPPKYGIRGIPTLLVFKEGKVEGTHSGFVSKPQLVNFINSNI